MRLPQSAGSSPRAWGTHLMPFFFSLGLRFIPTRVGNTCHDPLEARSLPVHPHARGEHVSQNAHKQGGHGSSPRAWGTPVPPVQTRNRFRFIPTRVGNTHYHRHTSRQRSVHPHARGDEPETVSG